MFKLSNFFRSLKRMEKYDYMKSSHFFKTARGLEKRYRSATTKEDKRYARDLIENLVQENPSSRNVNSYKTSVRERIKVLNDKIGGKIFNEENISDFFEVMNRIHAAYEDFFYDSDQMVEDYATNVIIGGMDKEKFIQQMTEGI